MPSDAFPGANAPQPKVVVEQVPKSELEIAQADLKWTEDMLANFQEPDFFRNENKRTEAINLFEKFIREKKEYIAGLQ